MGSEQRKMMLAGALAAAAAAVCVYAFVGRSREKYAPLVPGPKDYARKAYHEEVRTQCEAVDRLAETRAPEAMPVLLDRLQNGTDEVAATSARWLGTYGDRASVQPLAKQLETRPTLVKFAVVKALEKIADPEALTALKAQVTEQSGVAADSALAIGRLKDPKTGAIPAAAEDALIEYLLSPIPKIRMGAILGLRDGGTARAPEPLRRLAADPLKGIAPAILARPVDEGRMATPEILGSPCAEAIRAIEQRLGRERGAP